MRIYYILIISFITVLNSMAQTQITGILVADNKEPLIGAEVILAGTSEGTVSDKNGSFTLNLSVESGTVEISYLGYNKVSLRFNNTTNLDTIVLYSKIELLEEVVISCKSSDLVPNNENYVAVSTLGKKEIENRSATHSITELLAQTPSVYVSKSGGGIGDGNIYIRGFNQKHIAVLLNGIPMNDMESSEMYWSNLLGLENVLSTIQVQRGLGLSRLAISSVGGTINYITRNSTLQQEINIFSSIGNDALYNTQLSYASGISDNGFSSYINIGRQVGDGYIQGTSYKSYNYYLNLSWQLEKDKIQFTMLGTPQHHGQQNISYFNRATLSDYLTYGKKYNYNYGHLNGNPYNWYESYFHKPVLSIGWDRDINSSSHFSSQFYSAFGRGGGTSDLGRLPGNKFASNSIFRNKNGEVLFDDIFSYNSGDAVVFSDGNSYQRESNSDGLYINSFSNQGITRRAFTNSHHWLGMIASYRQNINKNITYNLGLDLRYSKGTNYIRINDLLGADAYFDVFNTNNPNHLATKTYDNSVASILNVFKNTTKEDKIFFHADGLVKWGGLFGSVSYKDDKLSGFLQSSLSYQSFQRRDYFNYLDSDSKQKSAWIPIVGGTLKSGISYKINKKNTVYVNSGYYSKQPNFDVIFLNFNNTINTEYKNEKVLGLEAGYGYHTNKISIKAGVYLTRWSNKFEKIPYKTNEVQGVAKILNMGQLHQGFEFETKYLPIKALRINSMLSIGNWKYTNNLKAKAFNTEQEYIGEVDLKLKDVKVPGTAQLTANIGIEYTFNECLSLGINQYYADKLYASIAPEDNWANYDKPLQLPSYTLTDMALSYSIKDINASLKNITLKFVINNLFDKSYITESATNYQSNDTSISKWEGINTNNKVFFGFGRTWNFSIRIKL